MGTLKARMNERKRNATCNSTSCRESGPESVKAAWSFSLRPSHKQHPGLEYSTSFLEEEAEEELDLAENEEEAKMFKTRLALGALPLRNAIDDDAPTVAATTAIPILCLLPLVLSPSNLGYQMLQANTTLLRQMSRHELGLIWNGLGLVGGDMGEVGQQNSKPISLVSPFPVGSTWLIIKLRGLKASVPSSLCSKVGPWAHNDGVSCSLGQRSFISGSVKSFCLVGQVRCLFWMISSFRTFFFF